MEVKKPRTRKKKVKVKPEPQEESFQSGTVEKQKIEESVEKKEKPLTATIAEAAGKVLQTKMKPEIAAGEKVSVTITNKKEMEEGMEPGEKGNEELKPKEKISWWKSAAMIVGAAMIGGIGYIIGTRTNQSATSNEQTVGAGRFTESNGLDLD